MAFRGRGRGRGRGYGGGGGYGFAKQKPFELFPDMELPGIKSAIKEENLFWESEKLQNFWKVSAYYLEETGHQKCQSVDIERDSDRTTIIRDSLSQILEVKRFPQELIGAPKGQQPHRKKVRWNPESELQKLDYLEKLEQRAQGQEDKDGKEKKEGENEDEDENLKEDNEEEPSDDDYYQNVDFDDDDDDFNDIDDGEDEGIF